MRFITHKRAEGDYQDLIDHLRNVAKRSAVFAAPFHASEQAYRMGLLHDIGKYGAKAQKRQHDPENTAKCDHSTAGARVAMLDLQDIAASFAIAGHHGGLPRMGSRGEVSGSLMGRIAEPVPMDNDPSAWKTEVTLPAVSVERPQDMFRFACLTRMLFSCLVDADYLDTESFMNHGEIERGGGDNLAFLLGRLQNHVQPWLDHPRGELGQIRNQILKACLDGNRHQPGIFTLTVPTGGGKTIASMAFALSHAVQHGKRRVIYVIPYTSIIEQNAQIFSEIFGADNVLEHHANVEFADAPHERDPHALAAENWDTPIVVTTAVQFFESLFAAKTSKCRKLHNIADSVVIFDEAQMLPIPYLRPCVRAITELVRSYGVTAVLCTATQPSLEGLIRETLPNEPITELCPDVPDIFASLERVTFRKERKMTEAEVARALQSCEQALCIVNTKKRAKAIFGLLDGEGCFHLSTLMTPNHRRRVLMEIRRRLTARLPCRVISTSLIEAGVDVDFPTVWREITGLDSILQAAGRCNREGKRLPEESIVHIFEAEGKGNPLLVQNVTTTQEIDRHNLDYAKPETVTAYFRFLMRLKGEATLDSKGIIPLLEKLDFPAAAEAFKLIEEGTLTVYIPTDENAADIERLRRGEISRGLMRRLGRDAVNVYPDHFKRLVEAGSIDPRENDGYGILVDRSVYHEEDGLSLEPEGAGILMA